MYSVFTYFLIIGILVISNITLLLGSCLFVMVPLISVLSFVFCVSEIFYPSEYVLFNFVLISGR